MTSCTVLNIDTTSKVTTTKYATAIPSPVGTGFSLWLSRADYLTGPSGLLCSVSGRNFPQTKALGKRQNQERVFIYLYLPVHPHCEVLNHTDIF